MDTNTFRELETLYAGVENAGLAVRGILVAPDADDELYVENDNIDGSDSNIAVVHFDGGKKPEDTLADFLSFWNHMKSEAKSAGKTIRFSDIKLQYSPNIYYTEIK